MSAGFVIFDDYLNEKLKDPEFRKGYERADKMLKLELQFNEMLREMGIDDMFVEVKDMDEY
jgi:hypothetical protein